REVHAPVPPLLAEIVGRCLRKDPAERDQSARESLAECPSAVWRRRPRPRASAAPPARCARRTATFWSPASCPRHASRLPGGPRLPRAPAAPPPPRATSGVNKAFFRGSSVRSRRRVARTLLSVRPGPIAPQGRSASGGVELRRQRTIAEKISCTGIGLHTG